MSGYTKLFNSLLTSTIWCGQDPETKVVWITMLALANRDGVVECTLPGLAKMAEVSVDKVAEAIRKLSEPDDLSRTKNSDGRRIEPVEDGWHLVNYDLYRWKSSPDEASDRQRRYRLRKKRALNAANALRNHNDVTKSNATHIAEAYIPPTPLSQNKRNENVTAAVGKKTKLKTCEMPECKNPTRLGERYCNTCREYANRINQKYGN